MNKQKAKHELGLPPGPMASGRVENHVKAKDLLLGRDDDVRREGIEVFNKYQK